MCDSPLFAPGPGLLFFPGLTTYTGGRGLGQEQLSLRPPERVANPRDKRTRHGSLAGRHTAEMTSAESGGFAKVGPGVNSKQRLNHHTAHLPSLCVAFTAIRVRLLTKIVNPQTQEKSW